MTKYKKEDFLKKGEAESVQHTHKILPTHPTDEEIKLLCDSAYIDPDDPPEDEPYIIKINGRDTGSLGSFSLTTGRAKSRKTFFNIFLAIAAVKGEYYNTVVNLPDEKKNILFIDTEQSKMEAYKALQKTISAASQARSVIKYYHLRANTVEQRVQMIDLLIRKTEGIGLIFIDGIRDLVNDINSAEEATKIATKLLQWSGEYNIHIVCCLHLNKSDNHARGHIGTELINKAQTVINIEKNEKDKTYSVVICTSARGLEFEPFSIGHDPAGLPEIFDFIPQKSRANVPENYDPMFHRKKLLSIFKGNGKQYKEMITDIEELYDVCERKAKTEFKKYFDNQGWIKKSGNLWYYTDQIDAKESEQDNDDLPF